MKISFLLTKVTDQEIFLTELKRSVERLESENTTLRQLLEENKISLKNTNKKLEDVAAKNNTRWQSCNKEVNGWKEKIEKKLFLDCKQRIDLQDALGLSQGIGPGEELLTLYQHCNRCDFDEKKKDLVSQVVASVQDTKKILQIQDSEIKVIRPATNDLAKRLGSQKTSIEKINAKIEQLNKKNLMFETDLAGSVTMVRSVQDESRKLLSINDFRVFKEVST